MLAENEDCQKKDLKKLLDEDKKTRDLKIYRDVVKHNMSQDRIDVLRASHQHPSFSSLWAYDATSAPQSKPLSEQVDNNRRWYKPALIYSDPLPSGDATSPSYRRQEPRKTSEQVSIPNSVCGWRGQIGRFRRNVVNAMAAPSTAQGHMLFQTGTKNKKKAQTKVEKKVDPHFC